MAYVLYVWRITSPVVWPFNVVGCTHSMWSDALWSLWFHEAIDPFYSPSALCCKRKDRPMGLLESQPHPLSSQALNEHVASAAAHKFPERVETTLALEGSALARMVLYVGHAWAPPRGQRGDSPAVGSDRQRGLDLTAFLALLCPSLAACGRVLSVLRHQKAQKDDSQRTGKRGTGPLSFPPDQARKPTQRSKVPQTVPGADLVGGPGG